MGLELVPQGVFEMRIVRSLQAHTLTRPLSADLYNVGGRHRDSAAAS